MTHRFPKVLLLLLLGTFSTVFIYSCCEEEYRVTGMDVASVSGDNVVHAAEMDTIRGEFLLIFVAETTISDSWQLQSLVNSAYALSCSETWSNSVSPEGIQLTSDQPIVVGGITLPAGTDLADLSGITRREGLFYSINFDITADFLAEATLPRGEYTFTVDARTTDGIDLTSSITVFFDL